MTRPEYLVDNFRSQTAREETEEEEVEEKKRKYVFWWGLLFFFLFNIVLIFLLEVSLHPRDSVAAAYQIVKFLRKLRRKMKSEDTKEVSATE